MLVMIGPKACKQAPFLSFWMAMMEEVHGRTTSSRRRASIIGIIAAASMSSNVVDVSPKFVD